MQVYEKYEWTELWFDTLSNTENKRILLIGDSNSSGYKRHLKEMYGEDLLIDRFGTSRAIEDANMEKELLYVLTIAKYDVIYFNNGTHGEHMDVETYKKSYYKLVDIIRDRCPNTRIIIGLTLPMTEQSVDVINPISKNTLVIERNEAACEVAEKYNLDVCDVYTEILGTQNTGHGDGIHLNDNGYKLLSKLIKRHIDNFLK